MSVTPIKSAADKKAAAAKKAPAAKKAAAPKAPAAKASESRTSTLSTPIETVRLGGGPIATQRTKFKQGERVRLVIDGHFRGFSEMEVRTRDGEGLKRSHLIAVDLAVLVPTGTAQSEIDAAVKAEREAEDKRLGREPLFNDD